MSQLEEYKARNRALRDKISQLEETLTRTRERLRWHERLRPDPEVLRQLLPARAAAARRSGASDAARRRIAPGAS